MLIFCSAVIKSSLPSLPRTVTACRTIYIPITIHLTAPKPTNRIARNSRSFATTTTAMAHSHIKKEEEDGFIRLGTPSEELRLEHTLPTGQSFRWRPTSQPNEFIGVLGRRAVILRQLDNDVAYKVIARAHNTPEGEKENEGKDASAIADYFNLSVNLSELCRQWKRADPHFARLSSILPGARMLRQDPQECLFSFICSQNNHISRIHGMVNRLCSLYGTPLLSSVSVPGEHQQLYAFPTLDQLSQATEEVLRAEGFGYRAKYIVGAVEALREKEREGGGGEVWLRGLRSVPFDTACEELCTLPGVGPKVAACVALFSLDKHEAVPVDVHVWNVAGKRYCTQVRGKPNTPKLHPVVQRAFTDLFGPYAGWAHNTLFIGELGMMKDKVREALGGGGDDGSSDGSDDDSVSSSSSDEGWEVVKGVKSEDATGPETPEQERRVGSKRKAAAKAVKKMRKMKSLDDDLKTELR